MDVSQGEVTMLADRASHASWHIEGLISAVYGVLDPLDDDEQSFCRESVAIHLSELRKAAAVFDGKTQALDLIAVANADHVTSWSFGLHKSTTATGWLLWAASMLGRVDAGRLIEERGRAFQLRDPSLPLVRIPALEDLDRVKKQADAVRDAERLRALRLLMQHGGSAEMPSAHARVGDPFHLGKRGTIEATASEDLRDRLAAEMAPKQKDLLFALWPDPGRSSKRMQKNALLNRVWKKSVSDDSLRQALNRLEKNLNEPQRRRIAVVTLHRETRDVTLTVDGPESDRKRT